MRNVQNSRPARAAESSLTACSAGVSGRGAPWARTRLESPVGVLFSRTADGVTYGQASCSSTVSVRATGVVGGARVTRARATEAGSAPTVRTARAQRY